MIEEMHKGMDMVEEAPSHAISSSKGEIYWKGRERSWGLGSRTLIMGILNVTPDSFYDGGRYVERDRAIEKAMEMDAEGVDIIDIGGESTRPGSKPVSTEEEIERVIPVVSALKKRINAAVSVDTTKAEVARLALEEGAEIINEVSALRFDPEMADVVVRYGAMVVLMHMRGTPETMQKDTTYNDLIGEIRGFLSERIEFALEKGIGFDSIAIDPGIGFGKSPEDNLRIIRYLGDFASMGRPIVLGTSRKSFIGHALGLEPDKRLEGTLATIATGILMGAHIVRVHDVRETRLVARMVDAIKNA